MMESVNSIEAGTSSKVNLALMLSPISNVINAEISLPLLSAPSF